MTDNPYPVGTTVFAKLKGYPWWPARIESDENLPPNVSNKKPKQRPIWPVFFFGSYDYGWFGSSELKSFDPASAEKAKSALKKGSGLRTALSEALDPSLITHRAANVKQDDYDEDEDLDEDMAPAPKKKAAPKPKKAPAKSEQTAAEKKRRPSTTEDQPAKRKPAKTSEMDEDDEPKVLQAGKMGETDLSGQPRDKNKETGGTKKRVGGTSRSRLESDFKSIDDDISVGDTHNGGTKRSDDDVGDSADVRAKKKIRSGQPSERLLKLRHKLQKLLLVEGLADDVLVQNLERSDPIMSEVEAFDIDLQMLKDTKIGRLMKKISALQASQDPHKVVERSVKLIKQYKLMMEKAQENGGDAAVASWGADKAGEGTTPVLGASSVVSSNTAQVQSTPISDADQTMTEAVRVGETVSLSEALANSNKHAAVSPAPPAPEAVVAAVAAIVETNSLATTMVTGATTTTETESSETIQVQETIKASTAERAVV
ncbi:hypothetical protein BGZ99_006329 [Dissophora globulifera]|uniref:PWWP domain-containing protein n=1 Tax=Dissophora globulifera TaxID=979702 RepID=A0A9P6RER7_9FUNG|nr:hypothetical protein BGZ99_006329 [Dissophora globulifera]